MFYYLLPFWWDYSKNQNQDTFIEEVINTDSFE